MSDVDRTLHDLIGLFDRLGLTYVVMGGIAVRSYGIPRPTYDVDFTLSIPRERLAELYDAAEESGCSVAESYRKGWIDQVAGMPLIKLRMFLEGRGVDVDVFLAESEFQREVLRRRRRIDSDAGAAYLVSPEDLILLKLLANRPRDLADVLDVLFTQGRLDEDYLKDWAGRLNLVDRLEAVFEQSRDMS